MYVGTQKTWYQLRCLPDKIAADKWQVSDKDADDFDFVATLDCSTTECAALLCERGYRPAVLNFAHGYNCGGGFEHRAGSQEEELFKKKDLPIGERARMFAAALFKEAKGLFLKDKKSTPRLHQY